MACFISKPLWKHAFMARSYILTDRLNKVRTKLKSVIKSFEMTLNSKYRIEEIKNKNQRNTNMKNRPSARSFMLRGHKFFKKGQPQGRLKQLSLEQDRGHNTR